MSSPITITAPSNDTALHAGGTYNMEWVQNNYSATRMDVYLAPAWNSTNIYLTPEMNASQLGGMIKLVSATPSPPYYAQITIPYTTVPGNNYYLMMVITDTPGIRERMGPMHILSSFGVASSEGQLTSTTSSSTTTTPSFNATTIPSLKATHTPDSITLPLAAINEPVVDAQLFKILGTVYFVRRLRKSSKHAFSVSALIKHILKRKVYTVQGIGKGQRSNQHDLYPPNEPELYPPNEHEFYPPNQHDYEDINNPTVRYTPNDK
ncbi:hypothetical protein DFQ28_003396 [Apophysomyces sp. BC1034]|nr:hypothetical protein DFQ28_003396 [Apophysomyces sp. BC1034]